MPLFLCFFLSLSCLQWAENVRHSDSVYDHICLTKWTVLSFLPIYSRYIRHSCYTQSIWFYFIICSNRTSSQMKAETVCRIWWVCKRRLSHVYWLAVDKQRTTFLEDFAKTETFVSSNSTPASFKQETNLQRLIKGRSPGPSQRCPWSWSRTNTNMNLCEHCEQSCPSDPPLFDCRPSWTS